MLVACPEFSRFPDNNATVSVPDNSPGLFLAKMTFPLRSFKSKALCHSLQNQLSLCELFPCNNNNGVSHSNSNTVVLVIQLRDGVFVPELSLDEEVIR